ncbi:MAG: bifunctional phosphopantothenoylcysteine decarboxylase/phosphopantothenate--cysteine ligase CoaBC [Calditrichaeota bacterium]|nr:MAG: bifunctional phosphopantothenoylcysteine decarboxylase/phosphopantothenate--cysteine ligase CoaBC [Calditrichota bacterium]
MFQDARVLVGVTGGIAAYKSCELIRFLVDAGSEVRVMMTESAGRFITPLTLETLSRNPVFSELFPDSEFSGTHHINLADWAQAVIVAPATANFIGKLVNGIADDFVTTTALALSCPLVVAPAMNSNMWQHFSVQRNVAQLKENDVLICEPEEGFLAEGYHGIGRLARLEYLLQYLYRALHPEPNSLAGKTVLITAGRTEEPLDPARILTNRSTGKMGFALAVEAFARGARVVLVHGPTHVIPPRVDRLVGVQTAQQMLEAVEKHFDQADVFLSAAAVADFRPASSRPDKIKKENSEMSLQLVSNPDILATMGERKKPRQRLVGFAVETRQGVQNARKKLEVKNLDLVVLNNPGEPGAGFAVDTNRVTLLGKAGERVELPLLSKLDVARAVFEVLLKGSTDLANE